MNSQVPRLARANVLYMLLQVCFSIKLYKWQHAGTTDSWWNDSVSTCSANANAARVDRIQAPRLTSMNWMLIHSVTMV